MTNVCLNIYQRVVEVALIPGTDMRGICGKPCFETLSSCELEVVCTSRCSLFSISDTSGDIACGSTNPESARAVEKAGVLDQLTPGENRAPYPPRASRSALIFVVPAKLLHFRAPSPLYRSPPPGVVSFVLFLLQPVLNTGTLFVIFEVSKDRVP